MDRETAVIRAEMSRTRAELDQKLSRLQDKVTDLTPRRLTERYLPEHFIDRVAGSLLTIVGIKMAWSRYRTLKHQRQRSQGYARLQ